MKRGRNPYLHHGCHRIPAVVRVRAVTGEVVAGICLRCGAQVDAHEAVVWGVDQ